MNWSRANPFFATNNCCGVHKVIINCVGKVICWKSVGLQDNDIHIILRN